MDATIQDLHDKLNRLAVPASGQLDVTEGLVAVDQTTVNALAAHLDALVARAVPIPDPLPA